MNINSRRYRSLTHITDPSSIATRWKDCLEQFEIFTAAAKIVDKKQKRALLLHLSGPTVQKVFKGLPDTGDDYDTAVEKLTHISLRKKTFDMNDFHVVDDDIADQILANCSSTRLKEKMFREEKADLAFILKQGRILECSKQQASHITAKSKSAEINTLRMTHTNVTPKQREPWRKLEGQCQNCGQPWSHEPSKPCPAFGKTCYACGKHNNFSSVCRNSGKPPGLQR